MLLNLVFLDLDKFKQTFKLKPRIQKLGATVIQWARLKKEAKKVVCVHNRYYISTDTFIRKLAGNI